MARKVLNNKVKFWGACGKEITMRVSDKELMQLRQYSEWGKNDDWKSFSHGRLHNFSIYALVDYEWKSRSKAGRIYENFPYHNFEWLYWDLEETTLDKEK